MEDQLEANMLRQRTSREKNKNARSAEKKPNAYQKEFGNAPNAEENSHHMFIIFKNKNQ